MLTRGRYGFYANENAAIGVKDQSLPGKGPTIVTRSRAALGDIKNKALDHVKEQNALKNIKKPAVPGSKLKACDMSIEDVVKAPTPTQPSEDLIVFRQCRRSSRMQFLSTRTGSRFIEIENQDFGDTATVYPYAETIFNYLQNRELSVQPMCADFMKPQGEVNPRMRYILVNWLVQIHHSYKLQPETLYLCVALLDRYLLADRTMHNLAKYLLELTIQEYDLAYLPGNMRAAVALCLSRALCLQTSDLQEAWSDVLEYLSGYNLNDIRDPLRILAKAAYRQNSPSKYRAIFEKYRLDDFYGRVAALPQLRSCLMETLADLKFDSDGELNPA
ncbi:hypothetical protein D915_002275 [Fasciola hepatica]|uniref:Cyclin C-terminal domain-containing protein n=1 Tax=Fasciola hepatica TaxID=6192 RepID=A0A4E0RJY1_FASHE|nr:hypothetical protein D915_002275 [Fasciola hepatica]